MFGKLNAEILAVFSYEPDYPIIISGPPFVARRGPRRFLDHAP